MSEKWMMFRHEDGHEIRVVKEPGETEEEFTERAAVSCPLWYGYKLTGTVDTMITEKEKKAK